MQRSRPIASEKGANHGTTRAASRCEREQSSSSSIVDRLLRAQPSKSGIISRSTRRSRVVALPCCPFFPRRWRFRDVVDRAEGATSLDEASRLQDHCFFHRSSLPLRRSSWSRTAAIACKGGPRSSSLSPSSACGPWLLFVLFFRLPVERMRENENGNGREEEGGERGA